MTNVQFETVPERKDEKDFSLYVGAGSFSRVLRCGLMLASTKNNQTFAAILTLEEPQAFQTKEVSERAEDSGFEFGYIPELDGFRGAAILLVVAGHFLEFHTSSREVHLFALGIAQLGVLLFFLC